ncbi:hypothetical protein N7489_010731 [Penicillium chrysogenum]|uniref:uncharacterized protein n=1 Tax=Penicillium chrysogenum TaxID=5076 RepID=UPI00239B1C5E|nr:uncharacterized protein N7489_010731 [Penicillium chrysogenum]KAJ5230023.1 hypothetical protein N7489_010731 [Penicillium chrysogenum]KAJ5271697.1 hypothetical protein N7524_004966 [Penicillium chrysogenum]
MPALANSPKAWRSWYDQLHKLSKSDDVSTTELKQLIDDPPLNSELTKVAAEDMTPTDVSESFCLTEVHGPRHGSFHVHSFSSGQILKLRWTRLKGQLAPQGVPKLGRVAKYMDCC